MRIAVLTFHRAFNCGAMLQAWALKTALERMGHTVEFPACNHVGEGTKRFRFVEWHNREKRGLQWVRSILGRAFVNLQKIPFNLLSVPCEDLRRFRYRAFRNKFLPERDVAPSGFDRHYDLVISGSDQVFSDAHSVDDAPTFFCENKPKGIRAIAYAASYGDEPLIGKRLARIVNALDNFSHVSVREALAKNQLSALTGKEISETLDPTLLMQPEDYEELACGNVPREPYLFMYILHAEPFFIETAQELARRLGVKCIMTSCYQFSRWGAPKGLTYSISPDRLVQYARNAKYVLAGSFHGTVMGVMFDKPFLSLRGQVDQFESRPAALLRKLGCEDRLVNPLVSVDEMYRRLVSPLPDIKEKLATLRAESLAWLKGAINA
mgnify:CR=1 FL=1